MSDIFSYFITNSTALYLAIGILSLCIGSFLNVVIYRTPKMMEQEWTQECQLLLHPEQVVIETEKLSLSSPASSCPHCRAPIRVSQYSSAKWALRGNVMRVTTRLQSATPPLKCLRC